MNAVSSVNRRVILPRGPRSPCPCSMFLAIGGRAHRIATSRPVPWTRRRGYLQYVYRSYRDSQPPQGLHLATLRFFTLKRPCSCQCWKRSWEKMHCHCVHVSVSWSLERGRDPFRFVSFLSFLPSLVWLNPCTVVYLRRLESRWVPYRIYCTRDKVLYCSVCIAVYRCQTCQPGNSLLSFPFILLLVVTLIRASGDLLRIWIL